MIGDLIANMAAWAAPELGYGVFHLLVPMGSGGRVSRCSGQVLAWSGITVTVSRDEFPVLHTVARWPGFLVTCCHLHPVAAVQVAAAKRVAWWYHRAMAWCRLRRADQRNLKASWAGVRSPPAQSAARRASRAVSATESLAG